MISGCSTAHCGGCNDDFDDADAPLRGDLNPSMLRWCSTWLWISEELGCSAAWVFPAPLLGSDEAPLAPQGSRDDPSHGRVACFECRSYFATPGGDQCGGWSLQWCVELLVPAVSIKLPTISCGPQTSVLTVTPKTRPARLCQWRPYAAAVSHGASSL